MGFNNIEPHHRPRPGNLNLREITEVKRNRADRAMIVSLMKAV